VLVYASPRRAWPHKALGETERRGLVGQGRRSTLADTRREGQ
jgi:hypothetical protein